MRTQHTVSSNARCKTRKPAAAPRPCQARASPASRAWGTVRASRVPSIYRPHGPLRGTPLQEDPAGPGSHASPAGEGKRSGCSRRLLTHPGDARGAPAAGAGRGPQDWAGVRRQLAAQRPPPRRPRPHREEGQRGRCKTTFAPIALPAASLPADVTSRGGRGLEVWWAGPPGLGRSTPWDYL